jgi:Domain of unknown function (DUF1887)
MDLPETQHLFLLVGENPLPNYVAAYLFLFGKEGLVQLVHTNGTYRQAQQLSTVLQNKGINCNYLPLGNSESNASGIQSKIRARIQELPNPINSIGLHYTGGTKAMAVHAYQTLKEHDENTCFSYLDSRRLELCIDQGGGESRTIKIVPNDISLTVLELVEELHGWEKQSEPNRQPLYIEAAKAFQEFHQDQDLANEWKKSCSSNFRRNHSDKWKTEGDLKRINILGDEFLKSSEDVTSANSFNLSSHPEILEALQLLENIRTQPMSEATCKWLDGEWLEHYVLCEIQGISRECIINDSINSLKIRDPATNVRKDKFEVDVLFTRGYQLFAISCTTSNDRGMCKLKLFEAYIRAQQLGGVEARVAFVCCGGSDITGGLKKEILNVFPRIDGETEDYRIEVFGREDLPDLGEKIAEWIKNVDRVAQ